MSAEIINFQNYKTKRDLGKLLEMGAIGQEDHDGLVKLTTMTTKEVYEDVQTGHQFELSEYALLVLGDNSWWECMENGGK